jgi:hypothetical protein
MEIQLTQGKTTVIDDEDFGRISQHKWHAKLCNKRYWRVYASDAEHTAMHRLIMNAPEGMFVDHINRDTLDNRKSNLRICSRSQNQHNQGVWSGRQGHKTSKYKGVCVSGNRWRAQIGDNGKRVRIGYFAVEIDAARAYDAAALKLYGEYACLNFPEIKNQPAGKAHTG